MKISSINGIRLKTEHNRFLYAYKFQILHFFSDKTFFHDIQNRNAVLNIIIILLFLYIGLCLVKLL